MRLVKSKKGEFTDKGEKTDCQAADFCAFCGDIHTDTGMNCDIVCEWATCGSRTLFFLFFIFIF